MSESTDNNSAKHSIKDKSGLCIWKYKKLHNMFKAPLTKYKIRKSNLLS